MSKIAILSDIHGNLPAFEAVLRDVVDSGAGGIAFGGDIVGYGASPGECVEIVQSLGGYCVFGNHDHTKLSPMSPPRCATVSASSHPGPLASQLPARIGTSFLSAALAFGGRRRRGATPDFSGAKTLSI